MRKDKVIFIIILFTTFSLFIPDSGNLKKNFEVLNDDNRSYISRTKVSDYIFLQSPANNSILKSETLIIFEIDDTDLLRLEYNWDSNPNISWSPPYDTLLPKGDGPHILNIYALDDLDTWEYQRFYFVADNTEPVIQLEYNANESELAPETPIGLSITDLHLNEVSYSWNTGANQSLVEPFYVNLPKDEGNHLLFIYASDHAGNWGSEIFRFTVQAGKPIDSDNDGLSDFIELMLGTDPHQPTNRIFEAPIAISDLENDSPNDLNTALVSHQHISSKTWILGTVDEEEREDQTDYYIFTSKIRTTGRVFIQCNIPGIKLRIFDLEGRINTTIIVDPEIWHAGKGVSITKSTDFLPNPLPYLVDIPIPLAIELLVVQIEGGIIGNTFYSLWIEDTPIQPHMELLSLILNLVLFLGLPSMFFLILRWEHRRATKRQEKERREIEQREMYQEYGTPKQETKKYPIVVDVRLKEWIFSSFILIVMVFLFIELSREKFQNHVSILTAKGFVDLGYRIFFLAVTLIILGIIISLVSWIRNRLRRRIIEETKHSWIRRISNITIKVLIVLTIYYILWILFLRFIIVLKAYITSSEVTDITNLLTVFFVNDLTSPPTPEQSSLLLNMGILEVIFLVFGLPLALYMFILNFGGGTAVRKVFRSAEKKKSRWNYKTVILGVSLIIELYRIFSNLINSLITGLFAENSTLFFIQISELPWWHQIVTWVSQETLISTPVIYGLYFELQGIFFAWVIYTSLPTVFRRLMTGSGYSKSLIRIGLFLLGMFVVFLRTLHMLLLIPIGVSSFPFSVTLTGPFSILLIIAMISEWLEIIGFSLGLLLVVYLQRKRRKKTKEEEISPRDIDELLEERADIERDTLAISYEEE